MKFSEEYKKSAESMSPDRQTIDRMKAAVLRELQEHPDVTPEPLPGPKKPLPLRRIAYIGGAAAACAAITIAAVNVLPSLGTSSNMVAGVDSSACMEEAAADTAPESAMPANEAGKTFTDEAEGADVPYDELPRFDAGDISADTAGAADSWGIASITTTAAVIGDIPEDSPEIAETPADDFSIEADRDLADNSKGWSPSFIESVTVEEPACDSFEDDLKRNPGAGSEDHEEDDTLSDIPADSTCDSESATEDVCTEEAAEETENDNPSAGGGDSSSTRYFSHIIILTGNGWLTYDGMRFNIVPGAECPGDVFQMEQREIAASPDESVIYWYLLKNDTIYLYDVHYSYIGTYKLA